MSTVVTRGYSTGSNISSIPLVVTGGYSPALEVIEWLACFNGVLKDDAIFNGCQVEQVFNGVQLDDATFNGQIDTSKNCGVIPTKC